MKKLSFVVSILAMITLTFFGCSNPAGGGSSSSNSNGGGTNPGNSHQMTLIGTKSDLNIGQFYLYEEVFESREINGPKNKEVGTITFINGVATIKDTNGNLKETLQIAEAPLPKDIKESIGEDVGNTKMYAMDTTLPTTVIVNESISGSSITGAKYITMLDPTLVTGFQIFSNDKTYSASIIKLEDGNYPTPDPNEGGNISDQKAESIIETAFGTSKWECEVAREEAKPIHQGGYEENAEEGDFIVTKMTIKLIEPSSNKASYGPQVYLLKKDNTSTQIHNFVGDSSYVVNSNKLITITTPIPNDKPNVTYVQYIKKDDTGITVKVKQPTSTQWSKEYILKEVKYS